MENEKAFLDRAAILALADIATEEVFVPEWQSWVRVRGMTGAERDAFEAESLGASGADREASLRSFRARLVARTVVDERGNRLFGDADVEALGQKGAAALDRICEVACRLSGLGETEVEDLLGNSVGAPNDASGSTWPSRSAAPSPSCSGG